MIINKHNYLSVGVTAVFVLAACIYYKGGQPSQGPASKAL